MGFMGYAGHSILQDSLRSHWGYLKQSKSPVSSSLLYTKAKRFLTSMWHANPMDISWILTSSTTPANGSQLWPAISSLLYQQLALPRKRHWTKALGVEAGLAEMLSWAWGHTLPHCAALTLWFLQPPPMTHTPFSGRSPLFTYCLSKFTCWFFSRRRFPDWFPRWNPFNPQPNY